MPNIFFALRTLKLRALVSFWVIAIVVAGVAGTRAHAAAVIVVNPALGSGTMTLVTNGDFEANSSGTPTSWTEFNCFLCDPPFPIGLSNAQSFSGKNSVKASAAYAHNGSGFALVHDPIPTIQGQTYVLGGYFYFQSIKNANFYIDTNDVNTDPNLLEGASIPPNTWVFAYDTFTAQGDSTTVRVVFDNFVTAGQIGFIDDVSVTPSDLFVAPSAATAAVPEPGTLGLFGIALAAFGFSRRRRVY